MDDIIGFAVVLIIISGLVYALLNQIKYSKASESIVGSPLFRKQLKRKNKVMTVSLFGVLLFYTLNIVSGLNIVSNLTFLNNFTSLGAFVSLIIFLYTKFAMTPKQVDRSLYN
ncbi:MULTISPECIES: 4-aminobutyrate aminotransferase [Solibacillus]|uniref:4-aminobutyrate aminotransferase n=1 Tax=Solibacillus merdavium TaxID=2762218 RepID=A0ABR8XMH7_9BACL|nr:4-aminobutyrate aminotransferase [Solibacillus merdavium]MBD8033133.1 4-aminobutyrate aminotransferase [Solibacillus merdavium]